MQPDLTLSIDIETYGKCRHSINHPLLPEQRHFHPQRSIHQDKPPILNLSCAVTVAHNSPTSPSWALEPLCVLEPGDTFVFLLELPQHREWLAQWLSRAHTLLGANLIFDLLYLRTDPLFAPLLRHQTIIDYIVCDYLESESRSDRSLSTNARRIRIDSYEASEKNDRFPHPEDPSFILYNARDSHNALSLIVAAARSIRTNHAGTPKLSPFCISFYSSLIWSCVHMLESGLPIPRPSLLAQRSSLNTHRADLESSLTSRGLVSSGEGSVKSRTAFMDSLLSDYRTEIDWDFLDTTETGAISASVINRLYLHELLPQSDPRRAMLKDWSEASHCFKLVSSFINPLLGESKPTKNRPIDRDCVLPHNDIAYPSIFIVPSSFKDGQGGDGGQLQTRISFKSPSAGTFPPEIKSNYTSRFTDGLIVSLDLSGAELRTLCLCAMDTEARDDFVRNIDPHTKRAVQVFTEPALISKYGPSYPSNPTFRKIERQGGKHGNFSDVNWASARTLQRTLLWKGGVLVPLSLCEEIVSARPYTRPKVFDWQVRLVHEAHRTGVIYLPVIGQHRRFIGGVRFEDPRDHSRLYGENKPNEIINFPIQAYAAAVTLDIQSFISRAIQAHPRGGDCLPFLNVYDAIYFDLRPSFLPVLRDEIIPSAFAYTSTEGYWHRLQRFHRFEVPLAYELTVRRTASPDPVPSA